jgi:hypothetical protein
MINLDFIESHQMWVTYAHKHLSGASPEWSSDRGALLHQIMAVSTFEKLAGSGRGGQHNLQPSVIKGVTCLNTITMRLKINLRDSLLYKRAK